MDLIAKVVTLNGGNDYEKQHLAASGLKVGDEITVAYVDMGSWHTSIDLVGYAGSFNSVYFEFYEGDTEIDIYSDKRFNPYM